LPPVKKKRKIFLIRSASRGTKLIRPMAEGTMVYGRSWEMLMSNIQLYLEFPEFCFTRIRPRN